MAKARSHRSLSVFFAAATSAAFGPPAEAAAEAAVAHPHVARALQTSDEVDVIVNFRVTAPPSPVHNMDVHRKAVRQIRDTILANVPAGFAIRREFDHIPAVAGRMSRAAFEILSRDPNVSLIQIDSRGAGALTVSVPAIGADVAKANYHVTGKGVRVAVLDTGTNANHPDLKSSILATQHCFTHNACPPNNAAESETAEDDHGHGSHVTGIITSDGKIAGAGFAPDAEIVAVKVDDRNDTGYESDWAAGLDWVFSNLSTLKVQVINMSICTNSLYATANECDAAEPALARAIKNLVDAGVTIFAASGNRGDSGRLSAPACNTGVIAVGATYKSSQGRQPTSGTFSQTWGNTFGNCADATTAFDQVACFTNSGPRLDMVAPGAVIVSDALGTQTDQYRGTSQASPTAAGVAALMLECNPSLTPAQIKDTLIRTAVVVKDPKNGLSFPSIRADQAVQAACGSGGQDGGATSTGGSTGKDGGAAGAGGSAGIGGNVGTGGATSTGAGGFLPGSGGMLGSGGASSLPGLGGALSATGGSGSGGNNTGSGGASAATDGGMTTGGSSATGGIAAGSSVHGGSASGGFVASGGAAGDKGNGAGSSSSGCSCDIGRRSNTADTAEARGSATKLFALALVLGLVARRRARPHGQRTGRSTSGKNYLPLDECRPTKPPGFNGTTKPLAAGVGSSRVALR